MVEDEDEPEFLGPADILSTNPSLLFPRPRLVESNHVVIDPNTNEVLVVTEVKDRGYTWVPTTMPTQIITPEHAEVLRMHNEGIENPKRAFWGWFIFILPLTALAVVSAVLTGLMSFWYVMGMFILAAGVGVIGLALLIVEHDEEKLKEVERVARMRARHRAR